jgi:hypothetical protein
MASYKFEPMTERDRKQYEKFFFESICSMDIQDRLEFTIPLPQIEGLYFTSVQDTVERLTDLTGRLSKFQWRNCIFAPIDRTVKLKDIYEDVFNMLKTKIPSLFVRSYVYLVFIKLDVNMTASIKYMGEGSNNAHSPMANDFQIYYWNTKYEIKLNSNKSYLFGDSGIKDNESDEPEDGIEANPQKLFIVSNPEHELNRIRDANSDIIDAFNAYANELPLFEQTKEFLLQTERILESSDNARILVEGPARSGKTVLAMSLLAKHPKSKMLLMNWYFYDALFDAFKIWSKLTEEEIANLFTMPSSTKDEVLNNRSKYKHFSSVQNDVKLVDIELLSRNWPLNKLKNLPRWKDFGSNNNSDWRATPIEKSKVGDYILVLAGSGDKRRIEIAVVTKICENNTARAERMPQFHSRMLNDNETNEERKSFLLESRNIINEGKSSLYIGQLMKNIAVALHNSEQRFFHHDYTKNDGGCWIERGRHTECNITNEDFVICDEVQRLGIIDAYRSWDYFDETSQILNNSKQSFFCGDDFQMLNPNYDRGISAMKELEEYGTIKLALPESIGVPSEVGEMIKYLLEEHDAPFSFGGFEIQLLYNDDLKLVELFNGDGSIKKHYAIPNNTHFYNDDYYPFILRTTSKTKHCDDKCKAHCTHKQIPMITKELREKYKFFCAEAIMPNYALSAYELISREVESIYLKIPAQIGLDVIAQPIVTYKNNEIVRNWKKQHLYVLMTRATMKLVINIENKQLYEHLNSRLNAIL